MENMAHNNAHPHFYPDLTGNSLREDTVYLFPSNLPVPSKHLSQAGSLRML